MPDKRTHRGPHPEDRELFAAKNVPALRAALADYCLLLSKGYAAKSSLKLVGDRFALTERQRLAVMRSGCSDEQLSCRSGRCVDPGGLVGQSIALDGYNVLITVEAALGGGVVFEGRDGCYRDLASMHGTYRKVSETIPAARLVGEFLESKGSAEVQWFLDKPVSNSGRLKTVLHEVAEESGWDWCVDLVMSPDAVLIKSDEIVASSDSVVLDGCGRWTNLARCIIQQEVADAWVIDLSMQD